MKKEIRIEVKRLIASHIKPIVESTIIPETMEIIDMWLGDTVGKVTHEMADKELEEVVNEIFISYIKELMKQLKPYYKRRKTAYAMQRMR